VNKTEKLIAERQKFVEKVIRFVHELLNAEGKVLKRETHSSHMYALREMEFEGFRFRDEGSFTMFGGDEVVVYFQGWKVFEVKYHDIKEAEVKEFDISMPCPDWQTPLMRQGVTRIAAKIDQAKKKSEALYEKDLQIGSAQNRLRKEMERLRLVN
jgi:hypothetical protein